VERSEELASLIAELREMSHQPMPDNARKAHLQAIVEDASFHARSGEITPEWFREGRAVGTKSRLENLRGAMRKLMPTLTAKIAAVLVVLLGSGVAVAATLPQPIADAVGSVAGILGISPEDVVVTDFDIEDDGPFEFEATVPGGEIEFETDGCETELEGTLNEGTDSELEVEEESGSEDCDDGSVSAEDPVVIPVSDDQDEVDDDDQDEVDDDDQEEVDDDDEDDGEDDDGEDDDGDDETEDDDDEDEAEEDDD
jgi:hypothetical protein